MQVSFSRKKQSNKWSNEQCNDFLKSRQQEEKGRKTGANDSKYG